MSVIQKLKDLEMIRTMREVRGGCICGCIRHLGGRPACRRFSGWSHSHTPSPWRTTFALADEAASTKNEPEVGSHNAWWRAVIISASDVPNGVGVITHFASATRSLQACAG
jgi:hypothetical protein